MLLKLSLNYTTTLSAIILRLASSPLVNASSTVSFHQAIVHRFRYSCVRSIVRRDRGGPICRRRYTLLLKSAWQRWHGSVNDSILRPSGIQTISKYGVTPFMLFAHIHVEYWRPRRALAESRDSTYQPSGSSRLSQSSTRGALPSRTSYSQGRSPLPPMTSYPQYCTAQCLVALKNGTFHHDCPNAEAHGASTKLTFEAVIDDILKSV